MGRPRRSIVLTPLIVLVLAASCGLPKPPVPKLPGSIPGPPAIADSISLR